MSFNVREPGSILDGKYEITQRLGSGGMGEVYLVRHLHLQELRVVKILRQDLAADPSAQKRFMREARLATQIKHPNVAILYDFSRLEEVLIDMTEPFEDAAQGATQAARDAAGAAPKK